MRAYLEIDVGLMLIQANTHRLQLLLQQGPRQKLSEPSQAVSKQVTEHPHGLRSSDCVGRSQFPLLALSLATQHPKIVVKLRKQRLDNALPHGCLEEGKLSEAYC